MNKLTFHVLIALLLASAASIHAAEASARKMSVLLIISDDLTSTALSC